MFHTNRDHTAHGNDNKEALQHFNNQYLLFENQDKH